MALNDSYVVTGNGIADTNSLNVEGSAAGTGAAEIGELAGSGAANIYRECDVDGDGNFEISVQIDSVSGDWHSQQNGVVVSDSNDLRLRIENVSGGTASFYAAGLEVSD